MESIVNLIAKATDCVEFKHAAEEQMKRLTIPTMVVDMWWYGSRNSIEQIHFYFLRYCKEKLVEFMESDEPQLLSTASVGENQWEQNQHLTEGAVTPWIMKTKEKENKKDVPTTTFLPNVTDNVSILFHALFTQIGFDQEYYERYNGFALLPSVQMPANNRDIDLDFCSIEPYLGDHNYRLMEYCSFTPGTEEVVQDRFHLSDASGILVTRKRREDVNDPYLCGALSSFTTMFAVNRSSTNPRDRTEGVKVVGDHVGVACEYSEMKSLFQVLTVSTKIENVDFDF